MIALAFLYTYMKKIFLKVDVLKCEKNCLQNCMQIVKQKNAKKKTLLTSSKLFEILRA
jgi:hypothetical protein